MCNSTEKTELELGQSILVRGGYTGKKLHRGMVGSSVLSCGHWTKAALTNFMVADNVDRETLEACNKADLCEKCFPEYAEEKTEEEKEVYTGPKLHMKRMTPKFNEEGRVVLKVWQGSACGNRSAWNMVNFIDFKKAMEENPERVCSKCAKQFEDLKERVIKLRDSRA